MKKFPLMIQLLVILVAIIIIPISIVTWYSGSQIIGYSEQALANSTLSGLASNKKLNENALNNIAQNTVFIASSQLFDGIKPYSTYEQLNSNYTRVEHGIALLKELQRLTRTNEGVYSSYFYMDGADYIVSSDKGITLLDRYESIDWLSEAIGNRNGIEGIWVPRQMENEKMVLSYVLPLNRLSTSTKGVLVINVNEEYVAGNINAMENETQHETFYLVNMNDGKVISNEDKALLMASIQDIDPVISSLLIGRDKQQGYLFTQSNNDRLLYNWYMSEQNPWLYVHVYSMDLLMSQTSKVQKSIIYITLILIAVGAVSSLLLAKWLSKPVRELANRISNHKQGGLFAKNELTLLDDAFQKMQMEEEKLNSIIKEHEIDASTLALQRILRGEAIEEQRKRLIKESLPYKYFKIAMLSIDQNSRYVSKTSPEARAYQRYVFFLACEQYEQLNIRTIYYGEGRIALVINFDEKMNRADEQHWNAHLTYIQDQASQIFGQSVTIGVSQPTNRLEELQDHVVEAMELIKNRMIQGNGKIIMKKQESPSQYKYIYPNNCERRILNYLQIGDLSNIELELETIRSVIEQAEYITYENISFIYHQLIGVVIKNLNEKNINTSAIFTDQGNVYSQLASLETLDELEEYMRLFFVKINDYIQVHKSEGNHIEKIISYLDEHYSEDIIFEEMSKEIGISYSYMRKLVYEHTGKSLIDYINQKRIEAAKGLLIKTGLNVAQIASEVGYNNIQSFNRFFRKFEGVTPSSYKSTHMSS